MTDRPFQPSADDREMTEAGQFRDRGDECTCTHQERAWRPSDVAERRQSFPVCRCVR